VAAFIDPRVMERLTEQYPLSGDTVMEAFNRLDNLMKEYKLDMPFTFRVMIVEAAIKMSMALGTGDAGVEGWVSTLFTRAFNRIAEKYPMKVTP